MGADADDARSCAVRTHLAIFVENAGGSFAACDDALKWPSTWWFLYPWLTLPDSVSRCLVGLAWVSPPRIAPRLDVGAQPEDTLALFDNGHREIRVPPAVHADAVRVAEPDHRRDLLSVDQLSGIHVVRHSRTVVDGTNSDVPLLDLSTPTSGDA